MNGKKLIMFVLIIFTCYAHQLFAQKLKAQVTITIENLPLEQQEKLKMFKQVIEDYINGHNWTNNEIEVEFPITMQIFFSSFSASSFEDRYGIQILISDNSDVQYFDKRCSMAYQEGEVLQHSDGNWTSLTSLLDFYIYIVIGDQMDKFGRFMGTPYFEKARVISEQAKFGMGRFQLGWDIRSQLIQDILSEKNKKFREMKDFYYYGIFYAEEDKTKARKYCSAAIDMIEEIMKQESEQEKCKKFLSAHYIELIDLFQGGDKAIFQKLIKLDPDHKDVYEEFL